MREGATHRSKVLTCRFTHCSSEKVILPRMGGKGEGGAEGERRGWEGGEHMKREAKDSFGKKRFTSLFSIGDEARPWLFYCCKKNCWKERASPIAREGVAEQLENEMVLGPCRKRDTKWH